MRCCCTSKTAAVMASASAIIRRAMSRCMAHHRKAKITKESQKRKRKMEASYEASDRLVAARPAKRVPWVLRADGAGDVPAPSACIACSHQAKGLWLRQLGTDVGELAIDFGRQGTHSSDGAQSDDYRDQCVLDQILARFFLVQILQHVDHLDISLFCYDSVCCPAPANRQVSPNHKGFGQSGATAMLGSKDKVAVKAPVSKEKLVDSN